MGSEDSGNRSILNYPFYGSSNWDPIVSLSQSGDFVNEFANPHCSVGLENRTVESSSHLVHFPSDLSVVDMVPIKILSSGSSFGHIAESGCHPNFERTNVADAQENGRNSEDGLLGSSTYGKRKRKVSVGASPQNGEEQQKDPSGDTSELHKKDDEKKQNFGKPTDKQAKHISTGGEPPKENYIHVRAKRGQATNSHSLAERVRREKISERMRLLQELVPGCNKITGKAMMLDEIINYVQSLQQQVEFLSMKLATVNPELHVDIDRILSKEILHLRNSGLSSSHLFSGYPQGTFNGAPSTTPPFHPSLLTQHIWNNELQGILNMGFDTDHSVSSLGPNGLSKMEL